MKSYNTKIAFQDRVAKKVVFFFSWNQLDPDLEGQLAALNVDYENATNQKAIMDANYADIEETLGTCK